MNLGKQIDSLLRSKTSVYIEGLGVFRRIRTAATFDSSKSIYLPPISYVEFEGESRDGYDFITYLQQLENIDRDKAEEKLRKSVAFIIEEIHLKGNCSLDNLGTLVSFDDTFVFKPYDLSGFEYTAVEDSYAQLEQENIQTTDQDQKLTNDVASIIENEGREGTIEEVEKPLSEVVPIKDSEVKEADAEEDVGVADDILAEKKDSNSYVFGLIAAVAILALGGLYYYVTYYNVPTSIGENKDFDNSISSLDTSILDTAGSTIHSDTLINVLPDSGEINTLNKIDTLKKPEPILVDNKYIIIIGTHLTLDEANDDAEMYHKKGYRNVRVLMPNLAKNRKRVIWDSYRTREERDSALRIVRKSIKADAWGTEI